MRPSTDLTGTSERGTWSKVVCVPCVEWGMETNVFARLIVLDVVNWDVMFVIINMNMNKTVRFDA